MQCKAILLEFKHVKFSSKLNLLMRDLEPLFFIKTESKVGERGVGSDGYRFGFFSERFASIPHF